MIATSVGRSFTKQESLPLVTPADGAELTVDPTFQWSRIVGAHHYHLVVSTNASFSSTYDSLSTDYNTYTPYSPTGKASYANGTYYWKIEARTSAGTVIATSNNQTFTIGNGSSTLIYLPLVIR